MGGGTGTGWKRSEMDDRSFEQKAWDAMVASPIGKFSNHFFPNLIKASYGTAMVPLRGPTFRRRFLVDTTLVDRLPNYWELTTKDGRAGVWGQALGVVFGA